MYVKYDAYEHATNAASVIFEAFPIRSPLRGRRYAVRYRMTVQGELLECDGDLDTQIDTLVTAYAVDRKTLGLYHDDDSATRHLLSHTDPNLVEGPYVLYRSWPRGDLAEYAAFRTYKIIMEAIYDFSEIVDPTCQIIEYTERIEYFGTGGPSWVARYDQTGVYRTQVIDPLTPVRVVQSGRSVGWGGYVVPLTPVFPLNLVTPLTRDRKTSPTLGSANTKEYTWEWEYIMVTPTYIGIPPDYK